MRWLRWVPVRVHGELLRPRLDRHKVWRIPWILEPRTWKNIEHPLSMIVWVILDGHRCVVNISGQALQSTCTCFFWACGCQCNVPLNFEFLLWRFSHFWLCHDIATSLQQRRKHSFFLIYHFHMSTYEPCTSMIVRAIVDWHKCVVNISGKALKSKWTWLFRTSACQCQACWLPLELECVGIENAFVDLHAWQWNIRLLPWKFKTKTTIFFDFDCRHGTCVSGLRRQVSCACSF